MNENIKMAAGCLRRAATDLNIQISQIRGNEQNEKQQEAREERRLHDAIHRHKSDIAVMASANNPVGAASLLAKHHGLNQDLAAVRNDLDRRLNEEDKQIDALQSQIRELNRLATMLEQWGS